MKLEKLFLFDHCVLGWLRILTWEKLDSLKLLNKCILQRLLGLTESFPDCHAKRAEDTEVSDIDVKQVLQGMPLCIFCVVHVVGI